MLDLKYIRNNLETVAAMLVDRNNSLDLSAFKALDAQRLELLNKVETLKNQRNTCSDQIAKMKREKADAESCQ
jgi:seryl-tRNA synthetase